MGIWQDDLADEECCVIFGVGGIAALAAFAVALIVGPFTLGFWGTIPVSIGAAILSGLAGCGAGLGAVGRARRRAKEGRP